MSTSTGWVRLVMRCPACDKGKEQRQWYHEKPCGDASYINEKGVVECLRGGNGHSYQFKDWNWNCSTRCICHGYKSGYKPAERLRVAAILNELISGESPLGKNKDAMWRFSLCANLGRQCMYLYLYVYLIVFYVFWFLVFGFLC